MFEITEKAELLMSALGYDAQEWGWVVDDFQELQFELEANGVPTWDSFESYLQGKLNWKQSLRSDIAERIAA